MENKIIIAETERLILRRYKKEDLQDLFAYLSDKEVVKYEPYKPMNLDETKDNLEWRIDTEEMIAVESQEGTFPDACIATNFSLNENGDIM